METFGYYGRFWLSQGPQNFNAYVLQLLLILPAPIFIAATMYMSIRRIIEALEADELAPIRPKIFSKLFVVGDIVCFLVQISGTGMQVTTDAHIQDIGGVVVVVGLVFQILVFALFLILTGRFFGKCKKQVGSDVLHWKRYIIGLFVASGLIVLRNLVTGIEHAEGSDGYVNQHEAFAYIFEALPIFAVICVFLTYHPGRLQKSVKKVSATGGGIHSSLEMEQNAGLVERGSDEPQYQPYRSPPAVHFQRTAHPA